MLLACPCRVLASCPSNYRRKSTYEVQNEMRSFQRSAYPPGCSSTWMQPFCLTLSESLNMSRACEIPISKQTGYLAVARLTATRSMVHATRTHVTGHDGQSQLHAYLRKRFSKLLFLTRATKVTDTCFEKGDCVELSTIPQRGFYKRE